MKIQSISIVPQVVGCKARCKYCIAAMTPPTEMGGKLCLSRLENALLYARSGGAQTAIITSKGETLLSSWPFIGEILNRCQEAGFGQRDLHTNASEILKRKEEFYHAFIDIKGRLTNVTITVSHMDGKKNSAVMGIDYDHLETFRFLSQECGLSVRLSCVMNRQGVHDGQSMIGYVEAAKKAGVRAIVFRELWIPAANDDNLRAGPVQEWSRENKVDIATGVKALKELEEQGRAHPIFTLPWGQVVYDVEGLNVACSTCTENFYETGKGAIKSVVYLPDNHLYSSWEFRGSIIF